MSKTLLPAAVLLSALSLVFAAAGTAARAAGDVLVRRLIEPAGPAYAYISDPVSLYATYSNLYVGTADSVREFNLSGEQGLSASGGADDFALSGGVRFVLKDGSLTAKAADASVPVKDGVTAIAADEGLLYAAAGRQLYIYDVTESGVAGERSAALPGEAESVAAAGGNVYVSVEKGANRSTICSVRDGAVAEQMEARPVRRLTASPDGVFALFSGSITQYRERAGYLYPAASVTAPDLLDVSYAGGLFALTDKAAVVRYSADLNGREDVVVSASGRAGYFDAPEAVCTRKNMTVIADTGNDRVAVVGDEIRYIDYPFVRPVGAGIDDYGNIYVAHTVNLIDVFDRAGNHTRTLNAGERIRDLVTDAADNLLVRTDSAVLKLDGETFTTMYDGAVGPVTVMPDSSELYALSGGKVYRIESGRLTELTAVRGDAVDIAVDLERSVYALTPAGVYKYALQEGAYVESGAAGYSGCGISPGAVSIALSAVRVENAVSLDYGDILICDAAASAVKVIDGADFGVKIIDESFAPPVDPDADEPAVLGEGILYKIGDAGGIDLYEYPRDMSPSCTLPRGATVIAAAFDVTGAPAYSYVVAEHGDALVRGYARKARLTAAVRLPYSDPPKQVARVQIAGAKAYKYPSLKAAVLKGWSSLPKDAEVTLMRFAAEYRDAAGGRWYRVSLGAGEGYIPAVNLTVNHYQPVFIRPQYNATIVSANGRSYAEVYIEDASGLRLLDGETLPEGTRVEVTGPFDPSKEYTPVKYFDENLGTLDCYVLTAHVKYKGVNAIQIVAAVLICLTIASAVILFIWHARRKRKL